MTVRGGITVRDGRSAGIASLLPPLLLLSGCADPAPPPAPRPLESVRAYMAGTVQPAATTFWSASGTEVDATGEHELTPTDDVGWKTAQDAAHVIVDAARTLREPRFATGRNEGWSDFATLLERSARQAEAAVAARDGAAMMRTGEEIYKVCTACHVAHPAGEDGPDGGPRAAEARRGAMRTGLFTPAQRFAPVDRSDSRTLTIAPLDSAEFKYRVPAGGRLGFAWRATGPVAFDMHATPDRGGEPLTESYRRGMGDGDAATYRAAFSGIHGWFWQNRTMETVTVTVQATGDITVN